MRLGAYPHNIVGPALVATKGGSYDLVEISYYDEGRDEAKKSNKQLTVAMQTAAIPNAAVNSVIADLNTILGASSVATIKAS
jgi:predicted heme/steroid binding protein